LGWGAFKITKFSVASGLKAARDQATTPPQSCPTILVKKDIYYWVVLFYGYGLVLGMDKLRARVKAVSVSRGELVEFVEANPCVKDWLGKFMLAARSDKAISGGQEDKARMLCRFFKWLRLEHDIVLSPRELLKFQIQKRKSDDPVERKWLLSLVLAHSRDNPDFQDYGDESKYNIFMAVKSFLNYHEVVLTTAKGVFGRRRKKKNHRKQMKVAGAKKILGMMSQRDRAISMLMFQGGIEVGGVLDKFNYTWHSQVKPQLDAGCERMKIEFDDRKATGKWYFTYVGRDVIHELRKWIAVRQAIVESALSEGNKVSQTVIEGEPIFISQWAKPLKTKRWVEQFSRRWSPITTHMFRKLFKSEASVLDRGIDQRYVEFWMGHGDNPIRGAGGIYDRNPEIREEDTENEYARLEHYLNIYSNVQQEPLTEEEKEWMRFSGQLRESLEKDSEKQKKFLQFLKNL